MPSIFPKNHLSKDPQTWNAFIGQMQLNMHAIKCMCCCSARSALSCSSDSFILRYYRSQAQQKWSRLLDGSPGGPLLSSFQSFSDKTLRLQEKKQPPCLEKQKSMLSNSRNNHFHLSVYKEGEGKGRQKEAGGQHYNITTLWKQFSSVQLLSRARFYNSMDCSTPGLPVHHQLSELAQTHVHRVGDAIQPSHPLSSPSRPAFSLSQHQGVFQWVSSSHQVAKVLEFQLQHQSFQWIFKTDFL